MGYSPHAKSLASLKIHTIAFGTYRNNQGHSTSQIFSESHKDMLCKMNMFGMLASCSTFVQTAICLVPDFGSINLIMGY